ncbi:MAG: cysteine desulfurase-like protein, partial [Blastocatellia bacterium]
VELAAFLATRGLFVSHGDFYAQTVVDRLGKAEQGLVRIGCSCYTSEEEIERLLAGIRAFPG